MTISAYANGFGNAIQVVFFIITLITAWKVFIKYGEPGWKGIIPFYSQFIEYSKVWTPAMGIAYIVLYILGILKIPVVSLICSILSIAIAIVFAHKKSSAFGRSILLTLVLIFFPFIGNLYIGFNDSINYIG